MAYWFVIEGYYHRSSAERVKRSLTKLLPEFKSSYRVMADDDDGNMSEPVFELGAIAETEKEGEAIVKASKEAIKEYDFK